MKAIQPILCMRKISRDSSTIGKLINWWCKSTYYHIELVLDGKWISATPEDHIYVKPLRPFDHTRYDYLHLPPIEITEENYEILWEFINEQTKKKYDTSGLIWNQVFGINLYNKTWFCSELVVVILRTMGYIRLARYNESEFNPQDVYDFFKHIETPLTLRKYTIYSRLKKLGISFLDLLGFKSKWLYLKILYHKIKEKFSRK